MGGFSRSDEARNPPLPAADQGGCSANEATSFASVSAAKRLCRIVRVVAAAAALFFNSCDNDHYVVYTSPPPTAESLLKEKPFGGHSVQLSLVAALVRYTQSSPRGTPMKSARAGEARPRGKAGSERRKACFHPGGSGFHLPRGPFTSPAFQFKSNFLLRHTQVLCFFLDSRKKRTPPRPLRPLPLSCSSGSAPRSGVKGCAFPAGRCSFAKSPARRQPPFASSPARRPDQSAAA